jgi:trimethylamine--corrinoid protein Co-methyltransferase
LEKLTLNLLSEEEKIRVHTASLQLLEEVGLQILDAEAVDILSGAGAAVDRASKRVRFPAELVEEAVHQAPSEIDLYGRDMSRSVHLSPGAVFYTTNGYATNVYDPSCGQRHEIRQEDLAYITQLADSLDQVDIYSVLATPCDTPPETNDRYQLAISLANTTKHIWNTAYGPEGVRDAVEMATAVRGSREALRQYPLITLDLTTLSPLTLDERQAGTMIEGARQELPIGISPGPIAGATGPVTLAGTLVQANAEVLGAITLCQTVRPGLPVIFTQYTRSLDMATGGVTMGGPEFSLLRVATAEMSRYYRLPSRGGGMIADAKAVDAQMGAEKMLNCLMASLAGLTILAGVGQADFINTVRPDLMLIDNEIISVVRRVLQGLDASHESLALDVIAEVGPGGNFLAHDHTASHFRKELWIPKLWDRKTWSVWEQEGSKDVGRRAADRLKTWKPSVPPLPAEAVTAIWDVVRAADARLE